jgi:hypothetical protein
MQSEKSTADRHRNIGPPAGRLKVDIDGLSIQGPGFKGGRAA